MPWYQASNESVFDLIVPVMKSFFAIDSAFEVRFFHLVKLIGFVQSSQLSLIVDVFKIKVVVIFLFSYSLANISEGISYNQRIIYFDVLNAIVAYFKAESGRFGISKYIGASSLRDPLDKEKLIVSDCMMLIFCAYFKCGKLYLASLAYTSPFISIYIGRKLLRHSILIDMVKT